MKFGVILCSNCSHAIGVNLSYKNTTCPYCGRSLAIKIDKVKHKSNSEQELASMISKINEQLQARKFKDSSDKLNSALQILDLEKIKSNKTNPNNDVEVYEQLDPFKRIAIKFEHENESLLVLKQLVVELSKELGDFTEHDLQRLLQACSFKADKIYDYLEQLKNADIIFEPRPGKYRLIDD